MSEERKRILTLLKEGKITLDEADELLSAIGAPRTEERPVNTEAFPKRASGPKYLRVVVESGPEDGAADGGEKVNIRVPFQLLRAGVKLAALMPSGAKDKVNDALHDKGIDLDVSKIRPEQLEELVEQLGELTVDVDGGKEKVRIFCE